MNLLIATVASFFACGFWLFGKSFLNAYYDAHEWDNYAITSLLFTALSSAAAFACAVVAVKFSLLFVL